MPVGEDAVMDYWGYEGKLKILFGKEN